MNGWTNERMDAADEDGLMASVLEEWMIAYDDVGRWIHYHAQPPDFNHTRAKS